MATRPVFIPLEQGLIGVKEKMLDFKWAPGMAPSQKKKSIQELHAVARAHEIEPVLEISSKSEDDLGVKLSAFNLSFITKKHMDRYTVESAFQGSKVFEKGGPFLDIMKLDPLSAKRDIRLKESGNLIGFNFLGKAFPTEPKTFFYDWLYIHALNENKHLAEKLVNYKGFTDIEFNPKKSINCQGYAAALYLSLKLNNQLDAALSSLNTFMLLTKEQYTHQLRITPVQQKMF
jgi:hypothetical protein